MGPGWDTASFAESEMTSACPDLDELAGANHEGVHMCLRGSGFEIMGERGTKVPKITA